MQWRYILPALALAGSGFLLWLLHSSAASLGPALAVDCNADAPRIQTSCHYPSGATFRIQVLVTRAPEEGYAGFQVKLAANDTVLTYVPKPGAVLPPECPPMAQVPELDPLIFGCLKSLTKTSSSKTLVQVQFQCKQDGVTSIDMTPRQGDVAGGTHLLDNELNPLDPLLRGAIVDCGFTQSTTTPTPTSRPKGPQFSLALKTEGPFDVDDTITVTTVLDWADLPDADGDTNAGYFAFVADYVVPGGMQNVATRTLWPGLGPGGDESAYRGPMEERDFVCTAAGVYHLNSPYYKSGRLLGEIDWEIGRQPYGGPGATIECLGPEPTATPTPTPTDTPDADSDGDGCTNAQETSGDPLRGGMRSPQSFWDFFDTPDAANERDHAVAVGDISRVVARFGTAGDQGIDPLSAPPASGYHTAFDRSPPPPSADLWDAGEPDGQITVEDFALTVVQFGHSCA